MSSVQADSEFFVSVALRLQDERNEKLCFKGHNETRSDSPTRLKRRRSENSG